MISELHPFQSRDNVVNPATIPAKDFDPTPTDEEELVAVLDEDIYCENEKETNSTVKDESHPLFKTVKNVQLDTMETYEQVKSHLFTIV